MVNNSNVVNTSSLLISSLNCNGLGRFSKRKDVFDYLRKQKFDIYFLLECHWKDGVCGELLSKQVMSVRRSAESTL